MKAASLRVQQWRDRNKKPCPKCGTSIYRESKTCLTCRAGWSRGDLTIADAIYHEHHRASAFALIRARARAVILKLGWTVCQVAGCGYDKHVDAAHRRPIASFSLDTKISVVNAPANLLALCRNHHWEFDHDLLGNEVLVSRTSSLN